MNVEITDIRNKLKRAATIYQKCKIKLGVAKAKLVEAEFLLDLICGNQKYDINLELLKHDIKEHLDNALKIFIESGYEHLQARIYKAQGMMWFS